MGALNAHQQAGFGQRAQVIGRGVHAHRQAGQIPVGGERDGLGTGSQLDAQIQPPVAELRRTQRIGDQVDVGARELHGQGRTAGRGKVVHVPLGSQRHGLGLERELEVELLPGDHGSQRAETGVDGHRAAVDGGAQRPGQSVALGIVALARPLHLDREGLLELWVDVGHRQGIHRDIA